MFENVCHAKRYDEELKLRVCERDVSEGDLEQLSTSTRLSPSSTSTTLHISIIMKRSRSPSLTPPTASAALKSTLSLLTTLDLPPNAFTALLSSLTTATTAAVAVEAERDELTQRVEKKPRVEERDPKVVSWG